VENIYNPQHALELLRKGCANDNAVFRDGQEEAIRHIVEGHGRLLVLQKTGWGKSFVYFIATKLLRENGKGPALLFSPLLSLMRNQITAAERMGLHPARIDSSNEKDWPGIKIGIQNDEVDIILIAPERLTNKEFDREIFGNIAGNVSMLIIDEAHCISDWGHDFRPHYRMIERIIRLLPSNLRLLATTATANNRVMKDLQDVLGSNLKIEHGDLNRRSLSLQTIRLQGQTERLAWLAEYLGKLQGSGIIYTLTVRDACQVADWLKSKGFNVEAYTSNTENRETLENALMKNEVKALIATVALGMGFDKPDMAFVIHYQMPGSVIAYYQQVGRAGRALESAYGILLSGQEDFDINNWFINSAFPKHSEVDDILEELKKETSNGMSIPKLCSRLNLSKGRIEKAINLLSLESPSPIVKVGTSWRLTATELSDEFWERVDRITNLRKEELEQMKDYLNLSFGEHMGFLIKALDGDPNAATAPTCPELPSTVKEELVQEALKFLQRSSLTIQPRKIWPNSGMPKYNLRGSIKDIHKAQCGKSLCVWDDAGWGKLVKQGKYEKGRFDDDLVKACVDMFRDWNPQPKPTWITCIPSYRHPDLVPDFAERLGKALNLPFYKAIKKTRDTPEQKTMQNSEQQARNVDGTLELNRQLVQKEPLLLIDDIVDSRWTLTVAAWLLRDAGSGEVWPMTLSQATGQCE